MTTLYRQYRPQRFSEISGQTPITAALQQAIIQQRLAHAYLFFGPRGTGKTTTARLLAKRVNCSKAPADDPEPCMTCPSCVACQENRHIDVIEIDAASNRGIDDIRALREATALRPTMGSYKVYIIDEVHMLTNEAFAALLKTLEEPQASIIFILATTELHKVPATIASRCQVYRFRRATAQEMRDRLRMILKKEQREAEDAALDFIISRADGCYRDAESLLGQLLISQAGTLKRDALVEFLGLPPQSLLENFLAALIQGQSAPAITAIDTAFQGGYDPEQFLKESIITGRNALLSLITGVSPTPAFAQQPGAKSRLPTIIRALLQGLQDLAFVPQPIIALQLVVLSVCTIKGKESLNLDAVKAAWPQVIENARASNPVASTFLRALEVTALDEKIVTLTAHYALHHNFFEKPDNKASVEKLLSEAMKDTLSIHFTLNEAVPSTADNQLYEAVKEVFSQPVK